MASYCSEYRYTVLIQDIANLNGPQTVNPPTDLRRLFAYDGWQ